MEIKQIEKNNLIELINPYRISDQENLNCYIRETWSSLSPKTKKKIKGIEKNIFSKYYELPGILSERLFSLLDKNNDGILGEEEFTKGMLKLFSKSQSINSLEKFIFKIYDFDKDGKISKEDVRLILSYISLYNIKIDEKYEIESQNKLQNLLKTVFKKNEMDLNNFTDLIEKGNASIFFPVLMVLLEKRPFSNESISLYKNKNIKEKDEICSDSEIETEKTPFSTKNNILIFPRIKKIFLNKKSKSDRALKLNLLSLYETSDEKIDNIEKKFEEKSICYEGYTNIIIKEKIKNVYFKLVNKDLFFYEKEEEKNHRGILNLSGVFVKEGEDAMINNKKYYTIISTSYKEKLKCCYFDNIENRNIWLEKFKLVTEKKNIHENYELLRIIEKGKFSTIRYGRNIKTGQSMAIKIISKKNAKDVDLELAITEIKVLEICHHPFIIKLYDVFETYDYIYLVLEYCNKGSLLSYFEKKSYKLSELQVCEIVYNLSLAINFIHSFGVIHRDLKLENVLLTDDSNKINIRLSDFGLSKIISPNEKCKDPYGTIIYAAPEILEGKSYDKSVDIWSLGIITFFLLCGYLPFNDKNSKEIVRQIVKEPVVFKQKIWKNKSNEAKDFVDKLLQKDPEKRINISQVLDHSWFKLYSENFVCK